MSVGLLHIALNLALPSRFEFSKGNVRVFASRHSDPSEPGKAANRNGKNQSFDLNNRNLSFVFASELALQRCSTKEKDMRNNLKMGACINPSDGNRKFRRD